MEDRTQQKETPNDLTFVLKSERELEECLKHTSNENSNDVSLCFYLERFCKWDCSNVCACCLKNNVHFKKWIELVI